MTARRSLAFTTTVRVIDRVHHHPAHGRADAAPTVRAGLANGAQRVLAIADFAQRRTAIDMHLANLAGAETQLGIAPFACQKLHRSTCRTRQLRALARQHLNRMNG